MFLCTGGKQNLYLSEVSDGTEVRTVHSQSKYAVGAESEEL